MQNCDVLIIGGGITGLTAACRAAEQNKKVQLITFGGGTYQIGGGTIDVLGYDAAGKPLDTPLQGLNNLPDSHPYSKITQGIINEAILWLKKITASAGYVYSGDLNQMQWIPTAAGTLKPTCLTPPTINSNALRQAKHVTVLGFTHFKDFYPKFIAENLQQIYGSRKTISAAALTIDTIQKNTLTALDIARWLETEAGFADFVSQTKILVPKKAAVIIPPVLGTNPDCSLLNKLQAALDVTFIEAASMPPSAAGLRLGKLLSRYAKSRGVSIIENLKIDSAIIENGSCQGVYSSHTNRKRIYTAKQYILATGGLYGGGLLADTGSISETIFRLPIEAPTDVLTWSNTELTGNKMQPFAQFGIKVNNDLLPVADNGQPILTNVKIAGRNLHGYDFSFEKSGNGVAIASGYKAGSLN